MDGSYFIQQLADNEMSNYENLFSGSELDAKLERLIDEKMSQGMDEADILEEITSKFNNKAFQKDLEDDSMENVEFDPKKLNID